MADLNAAVVITAQDLASGPISKVAQSLTQVESASNTAGAAAGGFTVHVLGAAQASESHAAAIEKESGGLQSLAEWFNDSAKEALAFGAGLAGLQVGESILANIASALVEYPELIERARITLEAFTGSAETAATVVGQVTGLGDNTPFHTGALLQVAQTLTALGTPAKDVAGAVQDIAAAVAAVGGSDADLQRVAMALARVSETGVVDARVMRQLTSDQIPAWQILETQLGKTEAQIAQMLKDGEITAPVFMEAFHAWASSNDVLDTMAKRTETVGGAMVVLQNQTQQALAEGLSPLTEKLGQAAAAAAQFAESGQLQTWGENVRAAIEAVLSVTDRIPPSLIAAAATFGSAVLAVNLLVTAATAARTAIEGLIASESVSTVIAFVQGLGTETAALEGVAGAAEVAGIAIDGMLGPIGLVAAAVGLLAVGWETDFAGIRTAITQTNTAVEGMNQNLEAHKTKLMDVNQQLDYSKGYLSQYAASAGLAADGVHQLADYSNAAATALGDMYQPTVNETTALGQFNAQLAQAAADAAAATKAAAAAAAQNDLLRQAIGENGNEWGVIAAQVDQINQSMHSGFSAANADLKLMRDNTAELSSQLAQVKQTLTDLEHPHLVGMQAADNRIFNLEEQLKRVQLQIDQSELGGRAAPRGLTAQEQRLQRELDIARLQEGLTFDPQLRALQQAAQGPVTELTFSQAMAAIQTNKQKFDELTSALQQAKQAVLDFANATDTAKANAAGGSSGGTSSTNGTESYYYGNQNVRKPTLAGAR